MTLREINKRKRAVALRRNISLAVWIPLIAAFLAMAVYGAAGVLSYALPWLEANRIESHVLCGVGTPARLAAVISYDSDEPPANVSIRHLETGYTVRNVELQYDDSRIVAGCDLDASMPSGDYGVFLSPGKNRKIGLAAEILPSYKYVGAEISMWTDGSGRMWLGIIPDYAYAAGNGLVKTVLRSDNGAALYAGWAEPGAALDLCISLLAPDEYAGPLSIELSADYENPDAEPGSLDAARYDTARGRYAVDADGWPDGPCPDGHSEDTSETDGYIETIRKD